MKKLQVIFIVLTLFAFALPILKFNKNGTVSQKENRTLHSRPPLVRDGYLNKTMLSEYNDYFADRFGGRQRLISLNYKLKYDVFKAAMVNNRAIRGKGDWWFYRDEGNHSDFFKENLWNADECENFKNSIYTVSEWCKAQNIQFVFLMCPNKHSVYEEEYRFKRPKGITRADQITKILDELKVPYIFPRDFLLLKKSEIDFPLYYETDTHWNQMGAYFASTLLRQKLMDAFPNTAFPLLEYEVTLESSTTLGDILPMLGVEKAKCTVPKLTPKNHQNSDFYEYIEGEGCIHTKGTDETLPRALIFRDSFFTALEPFTSPFFSEAEYYWRAFRDSDKEYVLQYKPDVIIFENVERYFPHVAG